MAWIIVHGVAGNFYNSSMLASVAASLLEQGHDTCRINTRGRDPVAYFSTPGGNARVGAAYEMIADCLADIDSWVVFLRAKGYERIGLIGHSLGAVKAAYVAQKPGSIAIHGLICISPPRLAPSILSSDSRYGSTYADDLRQAEELVKTGKPERVLTIRYPQPMQISAATFLDKYGQTDRYDYVRMTSQISIPCLWCFGDQEVRGDRASFRDGDQALKAKIDGKDNHSVAIISNADHAYTQARDELNEVICRWISEKI
jgi:pimeloyl-ACP methyl ester carboxylesterase